jgi:hypothetical protein
MRLDGAAESLLRDGKQLRQLSNSDALAPIFYALYYHTFHTYSHLPITEKNTGCTVALNSDCQKTGQSYSTNGLLSLDTVLQIYFQND